MKIKYFLAIVILSFGFIDTTYSIPSAEEKLQACQVVAADMAKGVDGYIQQIDGLLKKNPADEGFSDELDNLLVGLGKSFSGMKIAMSSVK